MRPNIRRRRERSGSICGTSTAISRSQCVTTVAASARSNWRRSSISFGTPISLWSGAAASEWGSGWSNAWSSCSRCGHHYHSAEIGSVRSSRPRAAAADVSSVPAAAEAPRPAAEGVRSRRGRRVLVVDDNVDSATSLMLLLQTLGHEAESAYDGLEALEAVQRFAPDTVVLDIGLPRMNGYEVAQRLREQSDRHYQLIARQLGPAGERRAQASSINNLVKPVVLDQPRGPAETDVPTTSTRRPDPSTRLAAGMRVLHREALRAAVRRRRRGSRCGRTRSG